MNRRTRQMRQWLGPFYQAMAGTMRFEDGVATAEPTAAPAPPPATPAAPPAAPENLLTDPPAPTVVQPAAPAAAEPAAKDSLLVGSGIIKSDGTFIDDWYNSDSLPEDVRGAESLKVIKNLPDLVKRTVNAEKLVGKKGVVLPGEGASESDWDVFYESIGRPKAPDQYAVDVPDDMKSLFTDDRVKSMQERAFKIGATNDQFKAFLAGEVEDAQRILAEQQAEADRIVDEERLKLKREWGEAFDERVHVVKRLIAETFGGDETARLNFLEQYGTDPTFVRFAAAVGSRLVEHKGLIAELTNETPTQALQKIKELEATPGYHSLDRTKMSDEQRSHIAQQIREQYKIAYPEGRR